MIWGAVIVAAGRGTRFGRPKQLLECAGKPLLAWSIETFAGMPEVLDLVIVTEPEFVERVEALAHGRLGAATLRVVAGGSTRQESVARGLDALADRCTGVFVHDGARPLVRAHDVRAGMRVVRPGIASLLVTPVIDTIKVIDDEHRVTRTLDRAPLVAAQTPQFATTADLRRAHREAAKHEIAATDDATLLERLGLDVIAVEGSPENFKVTVPGDLERATLLLGERAARSDDGEDVLIVEAFVASEAVDPIMEELERRDARVDAIERDLPDAVVVRAFVRERELHGFGTRFVELAGTSALFTTHFSHRAPSATIAVERAH